ncbi:MULTISPECIES: RHS repeat domain-containing protein [Olivibacter]|jgi:YD repeat-containing protein|uniref:RHS repeat domain-containing protein n=1 Tax=Olivibacter oleidegradans TaxID=760123 RepID=A0ABV6HGB8_9SPHI|nr:MULTISPECIES: RHS repeat domain-containing protein [Olivibacter]QEL00410.1 RHS repeat protein [Olivibacter sp. LS-1]
MNKFRWIVILLAVSKVTFAQTNQPLNPTLNQIVGPSPNASALTKFGNIPVGPSTGIPQVSIPIYSYKNTSNNLQLDVSLDYHAGGVKLEELASSVGLGWALNAGGVITRIVRGSYDEEPSNGFINNGPLPANETEGNSPVDISLRPFNNIYAGVRDGQSDIFVFNFCGKSGKFMFGKNGDFLMLKQQNLKITKQMGRLENRDMIVQFTIIDEKGFTYVFNEAEVTTNIGAVWTGTKTFSSSWYLTEIIDPTNSNKITLQYSPYGISNYYVGTSETRFEAFAENWVTRNGTNSSTSSQSITAKRLNKIIFPNGVTADFTYDNVQRTDLPGDYLLKKISITDGLNKRGYELKQDYSLNRATLTEVVPLQGVNETKEKSYILNYFSERGPFPNRNAERPDHWGYYKGHVDSWIPREIFPQGIGLEVGAGNAVQPRYELPGSNRHTDSVYIKTGSLTKITYPSGGYTTFEMEANKAVDSWLNQEFTVSIPNPPYIERTSSCYVNSADPYKSDYRDITYNGENNSSTTFKITLNSGVGGTCNGGCTITAEFYNSTNPSTMRILASGTMSYSSNGSSATFSVSNLIKGNAYRIVMYSSGLQNFSSYIGISWQEKGEAGSTTKTYSNKQTHVGGLRVAAIKDYDGISSTPVNTREFEYTLDDGKTSSGILGVYPIYSFETDYDYIEANGIPAYYPGSPNVIIRNSSSVTDLVNINGSPVTYSRVVEKLTNNSVSNGKIVRYFTTFEHSRPIITGFPFAPADYTDWSYGLMLEEQVFNASNQPVTKTVNNYRFVQDTYYRDPVRLNNFRSISIAPVVFLNYAQKIDPNGSPRYFRMRDFTPDAGRAELIKVTNTKYDGGGQVTEVRGYGYDGNYYYLKSDTLTDSKSVKEIHTYKYPKDMVDEGRDPNGVYQTMVDKNMMDYPLENRLSVNTQNNMIYNVITNYFKPISTANIYVPQTVSTDKPGQGNVVRVRHHAYDSRGNVLTSSLEKGTLVSYLWSYNAQYPVAEVKNASQVDIAYAGFEAEGKGNWNYAGAPVAATNNPAGRKVYNLSGGALSKSGLTAAREYVMTYWVQGATRPTLKLGGTVNTASTAVSTYKGWTQYRLQFKGVTSVELSGAVVVDEIRLHPLEASMTTYTYDPLFGMTSVTDPSGRTVYYVYDGLGRLSESRDMEGKLLESYNYNYRN